MIADHETNGVFVADTLEREFPAVYSGLRDILGRHDIPLRTIPGTRSTWCRDYLPIQVSEDRFVQFRYAPDYLTGRYRLLRADGEIGPSLPFIKNCVRSEIVLDGGNLVRWKDAVILTDRIYAENPRTIRRELEKELRRILGVKRLIVIPTEPGDVVGHSDGVARFINGQSVVVNDFLRVDVDYGRLLRRRLLKAGLETFEIPYEPVSDLTEGMPSAAGNYINLRKVIINIVMPSY